MNMWVILYSLKIRLLMIWSIKLNHIPTVGFSGALLSYFDAIRFLFDARGMIEEGYGKVLFTALPPFKIN